MQRRTLLPVLPFALLALHTETGRAEPRTVQLPPVEGAARYVGTLSEGGKSFRVRTSSPWILCTLDCDIDVTAIDGDGRPIGHSKGTTEGGAPEPKPEPSPEPKPEPAPAPEPKPEPAPEPQAAPEPAPVPPKPKHESEPARVAPEPETPHDTASFVSVTVGLGKERLTAKGGISDYSGAAGIGGTIIGAQLHPAGAFGAEAEIAAHNYATSTKEDDVGTGTTKTRESKFLRLGARATGFYDFLEGGAGGPSLGLGLGLATLKMPALTISDASSGTADLRERSVVGPAVTVVASTAAEAQHQFAALLNYLPTTFGKPWGAKDTGATLSWRYAFVPLLATEVGAHVQTTTLKGKVDCPAVARCTTTSSATSTILQARLGLGYRF